MKNLRTFNITVKPNSKLEDFVSTLKTRKEQNILDLRNRYADGEFDKYF